MAETPRGSNGPFSFPGRRLWRRLRRHGCAGWGRRRWLRATGLRRRAIPLHKTDRLCSSPVRNEPLRPKEEAILIWLFVAVFGILLGLTVRAPAVLFCTLVVAVGTALAGLLGEAQTSTIVDIVVNLVILQLSYLAGLLIRTAVRSARGRHR